MRNIALLTLLVCDLFLTGCATQPSEPLPGPDWAAQQRLLQDLSTWRATGKLALRNASQAESASMNWLQQQDQTELKLSGPLGVGATTISANNQQLVVRRAGETHRYDVASAQDMSRDTGWDLPLQALPYWLKGLPAPHLDVQEQTLEAGLIRHLQQQDWTVSYQSYGLFDNVQLPTRLTIERGQTRARLIVRQWDILPPHD